MFYRERTSKIYSIFTYMVAEAVVELPFTLILSLIYSSLVFYLGNCPNHPLPHSHSHSSSTCAAAVGLNEDDGEGLRFFVGTFGVSRVVANLLFRCVAAVSPDRDWSLYLAPIASTLLIVFSGFLIIRASIPSLLLLLLCSHLVAHCPQHCHPGRHSLVLDACLHHRLLVAGKHLSQSPHSSDVVLTQSPHQSFKAAAINEFQGQTFTCDASQLKAIAGVMPCLPDMSGYNGCGIEEWYCDAFCPAPNPPLPPWNDRAPACAKVWNPCYPCGTYIQVIVVAVVVVVVAVI